MNILIHLQSVLSDRRLKRLQAKISGHAVHRRNMTQPQCLGFQGLYVNFTKFWLYASLEEHTIQQDLWHGIWNQFFFIIGCTHMDWCKVWCTFVVHWHRNTVPYFFLFLIKEFKSGTCKKKLNQEKQEIDWRRRNNQL